VLPRANTGNNGKRGRKEQPPQATGGGKIGNECPISEWSLSDGSTWRPWRLWALPSSHMYVEHFQGYLGKGKGVQPRPAVTKIHSTSSAATTVRARELPRRRGSRRRGPLTRTFLWRFRFYRARPRKRRAESSLIDIDKGLGLSWNEGEQP